MIKTIIFDLGRVVVNIDSSRHFKELAKNSGKPISLIKKYLDDSSPIVKAFGKGEIKPRQFYDEVSKGLNLKMSFNEFRNTWCNIFALNKDVEKIIKKLKGNFKLILLSNTDVWHFEYIKKKYKIITAFDEYVLSYKVGCMKPNPLIFLETLKKAKTLPFNCLYFDDVLEFIYVARLMGIRAFQYKNYGKLLMDLNNAKVL